MGKICNFVALPWRKSVTPSYSLLLGKTIPHTLSLLTIINHLLFTSIFHPGIIATKQKVANKQNFKWLIYIFIILWEGWWIDLKNLSKLNLVFKFHLRYTGYLKNIKRQNLDFFPKKLRHEMEQNHIICIWGVYFKKLKAIRIRLKKSRAKPVGKNLTARLALAYIWCQYNMNWLCASNLPIKKGFIHISQNQG